MAWQQVRGAHGRLPRQAIEPAWAAMPAREELPSRAAADEQADDLHLGYLD